jgi:hypothetical protein
MRRIDRMLHDVGMTRKDLCYRACRRIVPPFTPMWWLITLVLVAGACILIYAGVVILILSVPKP